MTVFHQPRGAPLWHHGGNFSLLERGFQAFSDMVFPGWMKGGACFFLFFCVGSVCRDWLTVWKTCLQYLCQNTYSCE